MVIISINMITFVYNKSIMLPSVYLSIILSFSLQYSKVETLETLDETVSPGKLKNSTSFNNYILFISIIWTIMGLFL